MQKLKKMICDNDTARKLIKVFGHSIVKDLEITLKKGDKKDVKT